MSTVKKAAKKSATKAKKPAKKSTPVKKKVAKKAAPAIEKAAKKLAVAKKKATKKFAPVKKTSTKASPAAPVKTSVTTPVIPGKSKKAVRGIKKPAPDFIVLGKNSKALFSLKVYRGEGMALLAMNWLNEKPTDDFVGFTIEYQEPGGTKFFALSNRLSFLNNEGNVNPNIMSSRLSPIQKFRWVHFPRNANM